MFKFTMFTNYAICLILFLNWNNLFSVTFLDEKLYCAVSETWINHWEELFHYFGFMNRKTLEKPS